MIPPPAPARPLISASDISPPARTPQSPTALPSSPLRRPADHGSEPSEQNRTPLRRPLKGCFRRRPSTCCFRRPLLGLLGLWETEARPWRGGGAESTPALGSARLGLESTAATAAVPCVILHATPGGRFKIQSTLPRTRF